MADELRVPIQQLESDCAKLIVSGKLIARIDSHKKNLQSRSIDQRTLAFNQALQIGDKFARRMRSTLFSLSVAQHRLRASAGPEEKRTRNSTTLLSDLVPRRGASNKMDAQEYDMAHVDVSKW